KILRRDFLNGTLLGFGAALLAQAAPAQDTFTGYGGVGDYATSNGDPWSVVSTGHKFRDKAYDQLGSLATDTGEAFDLLIVGGGLSGLSAAYYFAKATGGRKRRDR